VLMITHDLDLMANADYLIDMGPRGGDQGGQIVAKGRPKDLIVNPQSLTTRYLAEHFEKFK
ncbi:ABC transporter ATP-binding protein, partial [Lactobacillus parabuchneri]|nr:ABC transporter ATP-binding protein [Lentilactobacillus parabuchneri]